MKYLIICLFISANIFAQAPGTDTEAGRGVFKNRVFFHLERYWDSLKVCNNPHKGWGIHYYDNSITNYGNRMAPDDSLPGFPGLNDIYLRLAWSYLEPEEGKYNWLLIDSIVQRWVKWGHTVSFRITCKETVDCIYATPEWVRKAGAKGKMMEQKGLKYPAWAPDYADPVFLAKLEKFHQAFAVKYDGKPWVEYIDIGSMGEWGEGHTAYSGWEDIPVSTIKKHIDLHKRCYKRSTLIISDDVIGQRDKDDGADREIYQYCLAEGISFRDDSENVLWYRNLGFNEGCIRSPELFSSVYKHLPVVLESDHYGDAKGYDMWRNGSGFERGIRETHATFIGFHYYPHEWLNENRELAGKLANLSGYWYFPKFAMMPDTLRVKGKYNYLRMTWENHGVAPAYHQYKIYLRLVHKTTGKTFTQQLTGSDNRKWQPNEITTEQYSVNLDEKLKTGNYDVMINMRDECGFHKRNIALALTLDRELIPGWYKLGEVVVR